MRNVYISLYISPICYILWVTITYYHDIKYIRISIFIFIHILRISNLLTNSEPRSCPLRRLEDFPAGAATTVLNTRILASKRTIKIEFFMVIGCAGNKDSANTV